jgi:protein-arginine kinase activator protein McsA
METINGNLLKTFVCEICNKTYKNKSGIWKHKKIHNKKEHIFLPPDNSKSPPDNSKLILNILSCKYCNKTFTRIDNLNRHINSRCSKKQENNLEDTIKKQSDELNNLKSIISELINKKCKIHPKTLQKIIGLVRICFANSNLSPS